MTLLLGLLALSYFGSMIMRGRALHGRGRQSGAEWVLLGVLAGPNVLGAFDPEALGAFEPVAAVAVSWLALVIGVSTVSSEEPRSDRRALAIGMLMALATAAGVSVATYFAALHLTDLRGRELWIAALGVGLVSCEMTRHPVEWAIERFAAHGPLSRMLAGIADLDDMLPLLLVALPFALAPATQPEYALPWWGFCLLPVGLGAVMGAMCATLMRFHARASAGWGLLLGTALLSTGISWRLGLSSLTTMFAMGATLALLSRHRRELREMLGRTEQPVLLPILLLAGARVHLQLSWPLALVLAAACAARFFVRRSVSPVLLALSYGGAAPALRGGAAIPRTRGVANWLALGLMSTGALTIAIGLAFALRFPGPIGDLVLTTAALQAVLGEVIGPASLRRSLNMVGELDVHATSLVPAPPVMPAMPGEKQGAS